MKTIPYKQPIPHGMIEAFNVADGVLLIEATDDYAKVPPDVAAIIASRDMSVDPQIAQFEAEQAVQKDADYAAYVARAGQPIYKVAAVKIAAEKLGMLDTIETAIMATVEKLGDKALYVWWNETDAISRGDANWQQIEAAVPWSKVSASDLFDLAAQV